MFVDAHTLAPGHLVTADICIVGAGAAGITLARALADGQRSVVLIESGGFKYNAATQELYAGEVVGLPYMPLVADRLRFLGGSTNHWQGSCRPFDALDLERWPFGLEVLQPYYQRAQQVCQLGPFQYDPSAWAMRDAQPLKQAAGSPLRTGMFVYSPLRFGVVYRQDLATAPDLTVYLNANLVDISTNEAASHVTALQLACLGGKHLRVHARLYVLAASGIENARLLLNANHVQQAGLGNGSDLVGRYFMDHPYLPAAATLLADGSRPEPGFYTPHAVRGRVVEGHFSATDAVRRAEGLPPFAIGLRAVTPQTDIGTIRLPDFVRSRLPPGAADDITFHLSQALIRLERPFRELYRRMWPTPNTFTTLYICGPPPDPSSRVTLIDKVDALGMRECRLDWRLPSDFERTARRAHQLLAQELGRSGIGRLRIDIGSSAAKHDPMRDLSNGHHEMGTTIMNDDPHHGVVNRNCRMHGIDNFFIAGSSVFPSFACDDPTMTIVALALRLSDHLKSLEV